MVQKIKKKIFSEKVNSTKFILSIHLVCDSMF